MRERLARRVGPELAGAVTLGTFHALCARILRAHPGDSGRSARYSIYDEGDSKRVLERYLTRADKARIERDEVLAAISRAKNHLVARDRFACRDTGRARRARPARRHQADRHVRLGPGRRRARTLRRAGLRRPDRLHRRAARAPARRARRLPAALALPAGRRAPGHQPAAGPPAAAAGRREPEPDGGRRRPAGDLRASGRRTCATSCASTATTRRRASCGSCATTARRRRSWRRPTG